MIKNKIFFEIYADTVDASFILHILINRISDQILNIAEETNNLAKTSLNANFTYSEQYQLQL